MVERLTATSSAEELAHYHAFVDSSPQGIMYCKAWWLDAVAPGQWEVLVLRNRENIQAAWPLVYDQSRRKIIMPLLTQKLGVLYAPSTARDSKRLGDEMADCGALLEQIPPGMSIDQRFHEAFTNWLPFLWQGFEQTTRYTYVFDDLENIGDYTSRMTNDCRQRVRSAAKELKVIETEDLQLMYDINLLTFERQGAKCPYSFEELQRIDAACRKNAGSRILIAEDSTGNRHACDYMVYDARCAVSIVQGADPRFRKGGAQRLLDWDSINFAATVSQRFDFEGSVMPGVEPYNRGFGAKQMPYFRISRSQSAGAGRQRSIRSIIGKTLRSAANRIDPR
jgi:hypothetical protein